MWQIQPELLLPSTCWIEALRHIVLLPREQVSSLLMILPANQRKLQKRLLRFNADGLNKVLNKIRQALLCYTGEACLFFVEFNQWLIYFNLNYGHIVFPYLYYSLLQFFHNQ